MTTEPAEEKVSYVIKEWVPPENSIGNKGYWVSLEDARFKCDDYAAVSAFECLKADGRKVRLVRTTETVVMES